MEAISPPLSSELVSRPLQNLTLHDTIENRMPNLVPFSLLSSSFPDLCFDIHGRIFEVDVAKVLTLSGLMRRELSDPMTEMYGHATNGVPLTLKYCIKNTQASNLDPWLEWIVTWFQEETTTDPSLPRDEVDVESIVFMLRFAELLEAPRIIETIYDCAIDMPISEQARIANEIQSLPDMAQRLVQNVMDALTNRIIFYPEENSDRRMQLEAYVHVPCLLMTQALVSGQKIASMMEALRGRIKNLLWHKTIFEYGYRTIALLDWERFTREHPLCGWVIRGDEETKYGYILLLFDSKGDRPAGWMMRRTDSYRIFRADTQEITTIIFPHSELKGLKVLAPKDLHGNDLYGNNGSAPFPDRFARDERLGESTLFLDCFAQDLYGRRDLDATWDTILLCCAKQLE